MAATFLQFLLLLLGAAQATASPPCQGDPMSWCWDMAVATRCGWEQHCQDLWDSLTLGKVAGGDDTAGGDSLVPGRGSKCRQCTKVLKKIQALAGDDPDEAAVAAALKKGCLRIGRAMGKMCQQLVNKHKDQITDGLQNGDMPQDICAAIGFCQS